MSTLTKARNKKPMQEPTDQPDQPIETPKEMVARLRQAKRAKATQRVQAGWRVSPTVKQAMEIIAIGKSQDTNITVEQVLLAYIASDEALAIIARTTALNQSEEA